MYTSIENGILSNTINDLAVGNIGYSFPLDCHHLAEELYRINFHPKKLYLQIDSIHSKALLLSHLFVKLISYNFMFSIREDNEWKKKLLKLNNLKKDQYIEGEVVAT